MYSISQSGLEKQPPVLSYKYALKNSPEQIQHMTPAQLQKLCLEQAFLLWLIISIIRNPLAAIATRVLAVDLIISLVEKNIRGSVQSITERSRVYISGDGGIAKRLGVHPNTVSKCFKNLEHYQLIERTYVFDEAKEREYLDITLTPMQLQQPTRLQDKTSRKIAEAGKKDAIPQGTISLPGSPLTCPACESTDVIAVCRICGTTGDLESFTPEVQIASFIERTHKNDAPTPLLHKTCGDTNNAPPTSVSLFLEDNQQEPTGVPVVPATIVESVLADMTHPPKEEQPTPALTPGKQLATWLRRRIGHGKIIYATGSPDTSKKYLAKPADYTPDMKAYLLGDKEHMYGSYLLRDGGTTYVLAFDFDSKEEALHDQHEALLQKLAQAGASPVYWLRQNKRGHLELYFDRPVDAEAALAWCIRVCPELAEVEEVYPTGEKRNNPISWPLYQRRGTTVTPCQAKAVLASNPTEVLAPEFSMKALAALVQDAVTPASLLPPLPRAAVSVSALPHTEGVPQQPALSNNDIARLVIAEYNQTTTWDEIITLCGGANRDGKFNAVWRGESSNSVKVDADEHYACDYGRTAGYPRKLDKYEIYCLVKGGREFKKADLAVRCKAYRERLEQHPTAQEIPQETTPQPLPPLDVAVETEETPQEIVARLRRDIVKTQGYVITPKGIGKMWQLWPDRIGVVLEGGSRVSFFSLLSEMRQIRAYDMAEAKAL